jgi:hypothetical protein
MGNLFLLVINLIVVFSAWEAVLSEFHLSFDGPVFKSISIVGALFFPIMELFYPVTDKFMFYSFDVLSVCGGMFIATYVIEGIDLICDYFEDKPGEIIPFVSNRKDQIQFQNQKKSS